MGGSARMIAALLIPVLVPTLAGLAYLHGFGAPGRLIAVNTAALVAALVCILAVRGPLRPALRLALAGAATLGLFLPLVLGPEVNGVARWLAVGPLRLYTGALLLPLIVVLAAREARLGLAVLAAAGAGLALQPDASGLAGLGAASAVLGWHRRCVVHAIIAAAALALAVLTIDAGGLEPQRYTEAVWAHVAARSAWLAGALGLALLAARLTLLAIGARETVTERTALAALLTGMAAMAMIAPFPFPLIGYGASPILGLGFALAALGAEHGDLLPGRLRG